MNPAGCVVALHSIGKIVSVGICLSVVALRSVILFDGGQEIEHKEHRAQGN